MKLYLVLSFVLAAGLSSHAELSPEYVDRVLQSSPRLDFPHYPRFPAMRELILYTPRPGTKKPGVQSPFGRPWPSALKRENGVLRFAPPDGESFKEVTMSIETSSSIEPTERKLSLDDLSFQSLP